MKLFFFNSNNYGPMWFVMAKDKAAAIEAVRSAINKGYEDVASMLGKIPEERKGNRAYMVDPMTVQYARDHRDSSLADLNLFITGKGGATIDEHGEGEVVFHEQC